MEHRPDGNWTVVYSSPLRPIIACGCTCNNQDCGWTATAETAFNSTTGDIAK